MAAGAGLVYFLPLGVPGLLAARALLGAGDAWFLTAAAALVVDHAPPECRTRALGVFGLAIWAGFAVGPPVGQVLLGDSAHERVWLVAAIAPAIGLAVVTRLPRDVPTSATPLGAGPLLRALVAVPRAVVAPGTALACANAGYAAITGFLVLHLDARGIVGGAAVLTAFGAAVIATRLLGGRSVNRREPRTVAALAAVLLTAGLTLLWLASGLTAALLAAVVAGAGFSFIFPSLAGVALESVDEANRGKALAAFTNFYDVGVGTGALLAGTAARYTGYPSALLLQPRPESPASSSRSVRPRRGGRGSPGRTRGPDIIRSWA
jgi:predicted MFS family arabinose efflux permease